MFQKILRWVVSGAAIVGVVLFVYKATSVPADPYQQINTATQVCLLLLGAFVTLNEQWAQNHKHAVLCAFGLLAFLGMYASSQQAKKAAHDVAEANTQRAVADAKLSSAIGELAGAARETSSVTREISRIQALNSRLQEQLLASNSQISALSTRSLATMTGGHSFCYVSIRGEGDTKNLLGIGLLGEGGYPLSQVSIRMVDLDLMHTLMATPGADWRKADTYYSEPLPRRYTGFYRKIGNISVPEQLSAKNYNIFITASNGSYTESLRLRLIGKTWISAIVVSASYYDGFRGLVFKEIDKGFPEDTLDQEFIAVAKQRLVKIHD